MPLELAQYLTEIKVKYPRLSIALTNIEDAINQLGVLTGGDATQHTAPPDPPQAINISAGTDHVHVTLTDSSSRSRALNYFLEYSVNDPNFNQPHVEHLGASRGRILPLPAKDMAGHTINYYFRGYSGYLGSQTASKKIYHGTNLVPTAVTLTGASQLNLLNSTGSGTNSTTGEVSGTGYGAPQFSKRTSGVLRNRRNDQRF